MSSTDRTGPSNPNEDGDDSENLVLDARIEKALDSWFTPPPLKASDLAKLEQLFEGNRLEKKGKKANLPDSNRGYSNRRAILLMAVSLAASVLVAVGGSRLLWRSSDGLVFQRKPLEAIYGDLVARGFQPYYLCDDPKRFQETIQHRHGYSLALSDRGNRLMLGISYPGGWTSETTAILFRLDGNPVLVFVDSQPFLNDETVTDANLNIRVKKLRGMFLVEVSPVTESLLDTISETNSEQ
jgi:hypothetical protein